MVEASSSFAARVKVASIIIVDSRQAERKARVAVAVVSQDRKQGATVAAVAEQTDTASNQKNSDNPFG